MNCSDWSDEVYTVIKSEKSAGVCYYSVKNRSGDILHRKFYPEELNIVARIP